MVDTDTAMALWLTLLVVCAVVAIVGVTAQAALQHASRARLRLCADGGLTSAHWVLRMLEEGARTPTLVLVMVLLGTGGVVACLLVVGLVTSSVAAWQAAGFMV